MDYRNRVVNQFFSFQIGEDAPDYLVITATPPYGYPVKIPDGGWIWDFTLIAKKKYRMKDGSISESIVADSGGYSSTTSETQVAFNIDVAGAPDVNYSLYFFTVAILDLKSLRDQRTGFDHGIVGTLDARMVPVDGSNSPARKLRVEFERYDDSDKTVGFSNNLNGPYLKSTIPEVVNDLNNGKVSVIVEDDKSTVDSNERFSSPVD